MTLEIRLALAAVLASLLGWHLWTDHHRAARIVELEAQHLRDQAALAPLRQANAAWADADKLRAAEADRDRQERERAQAAAAAATATAERLAREAGQRAQLFGEQYAHRTPSCAAALAALDTACPSLKDY